MLEFRENEKTMLVVNKHWFVIAGPVAILVILVALLPLAAIVVPLAEKALGVSLGTGPLLLFAGTIYCMTLVLFMFLAWVDYYLDLVIVTNVRIITINQRGLFSREIAEIPIERVQDVTIDIHGIIPTFLKFGTVRIQTAGEREFTIPLLPYPYDVKEAILKECQEARADLLHGRSQQVGSNQA